MTAAAETTGTNNIACNHLSWCQVIRITLRSTRWCRAPATTVRVAPTGAVALTTGGGHDPETGTVTETSRLRIGRIAEAR